MSTWMRHLDLSPYCHANNPILVDDKGNDVCPCGWRSDDPAVRRAHRGCKNPTRCSVSSDMCENLTFGWGKLDDLGYWKHECAPCARAYEQAHPEYQGRCIPLPPKTYIEVQGKWTYPILEGKVGP